MQDPSIDERIEFWKYAYARSSFIEAKENIKHLLETNPPLNSIERRSLTISILSLYSRPFKQRKKVRLADNVVPISFKENHDGLILMRDKVLAHRDLDGPEADWGFLSQICIRMKSQQITVETISPNISNEKAANIIPLIDILISFTEDAVHKFMSTYLRYLPNEDAHYEIYLKDKDLYWLQKITK